MLKSLSRTIIYPPLNKQTFTAELFIQISLIWSLQMSDPDSYLEEWKWFSESFLESLTDFDVGNDGDC